MNKILVAIFLFIPLLAVAAKPQWKLIYDGKSVVADIYIDETSIKKTPPTVSFNSRTKLPPKDRITEFSKDDDDTPITIDPSSLIIRKLVVNCEDQTVSPKQTDFYDDSLRLTYSYKMTNNETFEILPEYDTAVMFAYVCGKKIVKRDPI